VLLERLALELTQEEAMTVSRGGRQ
jgi:hypothetical protein